MIIGVRGATGQTGSTGPEGAKGASSQYYNHWTSQPAVLDNAVLSDAGYRMLLSNTSSPAVYASAADILQK